MGFAEATLTLDNTDRALPYDADEVMVTSAVLPPGDSEFYINKKSARLRTSTSCLWTPAWAGRDIPTSARAALTRFWR